jgi:stage V sporulation protein AF
MGTDLLDKPKNDGKKDEKQKGEQREQEEQQEEEQEEPIIEVTLTQEEKRLKETDEISNDLRENKRILEEKIGLGTSFDILFREMEFGTKKTALLTINGFAKDTVLTEIMERLSYLSREEIMPHTFKSLIDKYVPHIQVEAIESMDKVVQKVFDGASALFIENETCAIVMDVKSFPTRGLEEPSTEKVVRGAKDGFTETLMTNVALIRRRVRDPRIKFEVTKVGKRTNTDVCVIYVNDICDLNLVKAIKKKINAAKIDGIPLGEKQLEELIVNKRWNPFPSVRYSERPDVIAAHLLEGHVIVMSDTSPSAMILPTTYFHLVQHVEEYRQTPFVGTYLRWVRFVGIVASLILLPLWFLVVMEPQLRPEALAFLGPKEPGQLPLFLQFLLAEVGVDLMRMAAVHTPTPIATAMGLVAAILIGDIAVQVGLFTNEVILYMAVAALGMFATPSYELGLANRMVRLLLLISVALFKVPGLVLGITLLILYLVLQRSFNSPYLWPFIPFDIGALFSVAIRRPVKSSKKRPSISRTNDDTRQPS